MRSWRLRVHGPSVSPDPRYEEPFAWWGPGWQAPAPRDIVGLLRDETIDAWTAANLWVALARRQSLTVVAGASGVGKTTLLTALLDFLPPGTRRVYLRGCFELFAFLSDPSIAPSQTALLINEISPHLPVYLWGPAVIRIPVGGVAAFEHVIVMERDQANASGRRVRGVWRLAPTRDGVAIAKLQALPPVLHNMPPSSTSDADDLEAWFPIEELARRQSFLEDLRDR